MKKIFTLIFLTLLLLGVAAASPYFEVDIKESSWWTDEAEAQGKKVQVVPEICNKGSAGTMRVECAIYDKRFARSIGYQSPYLSLFGIDEVQNCVSQETNVDTKEITLRTGECVGPLNLYNTLNPFASDKLAIFNPLAPQSDPSDDYVIVCAAFESCWSPTNLDTGLTDYDVAGFDLLDAGITVASCTDGIWNQDETHLDCGGSCSKGCPEWGFCNVNSDCNKGHVCNQGVCRKVVSDEPAECGNNACEEGEDAVSCAKDCGADGAAGENTGGDGELNVGVVKSVAFGISTILFLILASITFGLASKGNVRAAMILGSFALIVFIAWLVIGFGLMGNASMWLMFSGIALVIIGAVMLRLGIPFTGLVVLFGVILLVVGLMIGAQNVSEVFFPDPIKESLWQKVTGWFT